MNGAHRPTWIKANLPATPEDYKTGNGEGCFFIVDQKTKDDYDADAYGWGYEGILDNDSIYYPKLKHGARLPLEMRGTFRPVVPYEVLQQYR